MNMRKPNISGDEVSAAAVKFATELQKYPVEVAVGVGVVLPNLVNGCSWGFVTGTNTEFVKVLDNIKRNPAMGYFKIKGGYLLNIDMGYLLNILSKIAGGYVTNEDLRIASEHRQKALADLEKFFKRGGSGKIGIYNLNDSPRITVKGEGYPAFCVTMQDLLVMCIRNGYGLRLGNAVRQPKQVADHMIQVVEKLEIAPSGNALFIDVEKLK